MCDLAHPSESWSPQPNFNVSSPNLLQIMRLTVLPALVILSASFAFSRPLLVGTSEGLGARNAAIHPRALKTSNAMMPHLVRRDSSDRNLQGVPSSAWNGRDRHSRMSAFPPYVSMSCAYTIQPSFFLGLGRLPRERGCYPG
jgi:hypothetical protein